MPAPSIRLVPHIRSHACRGKVHGSLARAGKVKSQTPKVEPQEKKKKVTGRAKKRHLYNSRFVNVTAAPGAKGSTQQAAPGQVGLRPNLRRSAVLVRLFVVSSCTAIPVEEALPVAREREARERFLFSRSSLRSSLSSCRLAAAQAAISAQALLATSLSSLCRPLASRVKPPDPTWTDSPSLPSTLDVSAVGGPHAVCVRSSWWQGATGVVCLYPHPATSRAHPPTSSPRMCPSSLYIPPWARARSRL
ncbi:ribosomal protein S30-domain-containing protein [Rhodotorula diobovata]|uniref:Ribosomal protein S30-domain-containing protein n=1 Tax=Rhodotorula diobovata TaxID=5288 RepID=A0A5C5G021_9BASI|nr:ribosomal protein S30-domain-containing protein [Rhodotorula diobovata]